MESVFARLLDENELAHLANEIKIVDGKPVSSVLHALSSKVESILMAIEAETWRLGFIK
jgi:hypothetical protein